ncbi:MAG: sigma-70 family RNA polymerase sigma factor [Candidatus Latescibacteria bacterium]|nr:sigma-70 family RNA polymerase sigma factor [Candidatus Latescibacterota bacterium]
MDQLTTLVEAAQQGDSRAFTRLVARFQDMAWASAYARLGDYHLAQDAAQEAFIEAYLNLDKLRQPAAFPGWFRRFVVKQCDRLTRRARPQSLEPDKIQALPSDLPDPEILWFRRRQGQSLRASIAALPPKQREALVLFHLQGYSQRQVAQYLGVAVSAVGKRLFDARKGLEKRMLNMVQENLQQHKPDDSFSHTVHFFAALRKGDVATLDELLKSNPELSHKQADWGPDVDPFINSGAFPLTWAAGACEPEVLEVLVRHGADIDQGHDANAEPPLLNAVMQGRHDNAQWLLAHGAQVDRPCGLQHTPLHRAVIRGDQYMVQLLLDAGASLDSVDEQGHTPADWAAMKGYADLLELLSQRGAAEPTAPLHLPPTPPEPPVLAPVPGGAAVLGRILDGSGGALDNRASPTKTTAPPLCGTVDQPQSPLLETGLKAIDLLTPFKRGGHIGLDACTTAGVHLFMTQMARNQIALHNARVVYLGLNAEDPAIQHLEWWHSISDGKRLGDNSVHIFAPTEAPAKQRQKTVETGLAVAESLRLEGNDVLLLVEGELARTPGVIPYLRMHASATPQAAVTVVYLGQSPHGVEDETFVFLDAVVAFSGQRAQANLFPAVDFQRGRSRLLDSDLLPENHRQLAAQTRHCLRHYYAHNFRAALGDDGNYNGVLWGDSQAALPLIRRARLLDYFLTQPYHGTELWTGRPGETVPLDATLEGCRQILAGDHDEAELRDFYFAGAIKQALDRGAQED